MTRTEYIQQASIQLAVAMINQNSALASEEISYHAFCIAANMADKIEKDIADYTTKTAVDLTDKALMLHTRAILIRNTELSRRIINALNHNQINTVEDLLRCSSGRILQFRNFGRHSYDELCRWLNRNGYKLQSLPATWFYDWNHGYHTSVKTDLSEERPFATIKEADAFIDIENKKIMGIVEE